MPNQPAPTVAAPNGEAAAADGGGLILADPDGLTVWLMIAEAQTAAEQAAAAEYKQYRGADPIVFGDTALLGYDRFLAQLTAMRATARSEYRRMAADVRWFLVAWAQTNQPGLYGLDDPDELAELPTAPPEVPQPFEVAGILPSLRYRVAEAKTTGDETVQMRRPHLDVDDADPWTSPAPATGPDATAEWDGGPPTLPGRQLAGEPVVLVDTGELAGLPVPADGLPPAGSESTVEAQGGEGW